MPRAWGCWSRYKLELLEKYLDAFTTASKRSSTTVYLDLFGGEPENVDRLTLDPIEGSARIALGTADPPFTHLRFFEKGPNAAKLKQTIAAHYPGRNALVYEGDCNDTIHQALADLHQQRLDWPPTFAFIDPNGPHYRWSTLGALANHKPTAAKTKVELWMLFPDSFFMRLLPRSGAVQPSSNTAITEMFGTPQWHATWQARLERRITPAEARIEYVNLMRWRLQHELQYRWTYQLQLHTESNAPLYHLIFATDSEAGAKIMRHLYAQAAVEFPQMAASYRALEAQMASEAAGQSPLFDPSELDAPKIRPAVVALPEDPPEGPRPHNAARCPYCGSGA